jgi:hypothetical protein
LKDFHAGFPIFIDGALGDLDNLVSRWRRGLLRVTPANPVMAVISLPSRPADVSARRRWSGMYLRERNNRSAGDLRAPYRKACFSPAQLESPVGNRQLDAPLRPFSGAEDSAWKRMRRFSHFWRKQLEICHNSNKQVWPST